MTFKERIVRVVVAETGSKFVYFNGGAVTLFQFAETYAPPLEYFRKVAYRRIMTHRTLRKVSEHRKTAFRIDNIQGFIQNVRIILSLIYNGVFYMNIYSYLSEDSLDKSAGKHIAVFQFAIFNTVGNVFCVFGIKRFKTAKIDLFCAHIKHRGYGIEDFLSVLFPALFQSLFKRFIGIVDNAFLRQFCGIQGTSRVFEIRVEAFAKSRQNLFFSDIVGEFSVKFKIDFFQFRF